MNLPDKSIENLLNRLTASGLCFAIYRLPWADECRLVLQTSGEAERLTDIGRLNGKRGFVMAPFRMSEERPLVLLRPDVTACGWEAMGRVLASLPVDGKNTALPVEKFPSVTEEESRRQYAKAFDRFIGPLREKRFRKLVLSRVETRKTGKGFSPLGAFVRACGCYPRMMVYLCHTPVTGTWMGSTPEILLSGHGRLWHTVALAGTMTMQGEVMPTEWSDKNREEQACVSDYVRRIVQDYGEGMEEEGPYTARAGQLVHLKTDFRFRLKDAGKTGDLLEELHPTPAVCGLPKAETFRFINDNEGYDRRYYSGFVGWMDPEGDTELYVNLRCMEVAEGEVALYAGGGILQRSEVEAEWEETEEKMKTMGRLLERR